MGRLLKISIAALLVALAPLAIVLLIGAAPIEASAQPFPRGLEPPMNIGGKTAEDRQTAIEIAKLIEEEARSNTSRRDELKIYAAGGMKGYRISAYGITDADEQDRIVRLLKENSLKQKWKPIHITFFEKEIFIRSGNGYQRQGELKLHAVVVQ